MFKGGSNLQQQAQERCQLLPRNMKYNMKRLRNPIQKYLLLFGKELNQSVTFIKILTQMNTRIYLYQSVTNIFEYSNIRIYWWRIYIRTFVRINFSFTNIFGHSFVSNLFVRIYSDIRWWVCYSVKPRRIFEYIRIFVQFSLRILIRTFVRVKKISMNIFGYSFV